MNQRYDGTFARNRGLAVEFVDRMTFGKKLSDDWFDLGGRYGYSD
jgi:hypothetical protein